MVVILYYYFTTKYKNVMLDKLKFYYYNEVQFNKGTLMIKKVDIKKEERIRKARIGISNIQRKWNHLVDSTVNEYRNSLDNHYENELLAIADKDECLLETVKAMLFEVVEDFERETDIALVNDPTNHVAKIELGNGEVIYPDPNLFKKTKTSIH